MNFKSGGWTSLIGVLAAQARGLPDYFVLIAPAATKATPSMALLVLAVEWRTSRYCLTMLSRKRRLKVLC